MKKKEKPVVAKAIRRTRELIERMKLRSTVRQTGEVFVNRVADCVDDLEEMFSDNDKEDADMRVNPREVGRRP